VTTAQYAGRGQGRLDCDAAHAGIGERAEDQLRVQQCVGPEVVHVLRLAGHLGPPVGPPDISLQAHESSQIVNDLPGTTPFTPRFDAAAIADLRDCCPPRRPSTSRGRTRRRPSGRGTLRELVAYWADGFDFARFETELAAPPHLRATVGELGIHFLHVPGRGPDPLPLVLTHGWLSSFMEMLPVIPLLTDPAGHGANDIARLIEYYRR
jgi:hypothetical protein